MKVKGVEITVSEQWTFQERIAIATVLLGAIQSDIPAGRYSIPGRPNIDSVLHLLHDDAAVLNKYHNELEIMLVSIGSESWHDDDAVLGKPPQ